MKIDKENLIGLLADKTGMSRDEIEEQLEQLIKRIVDAAERGKALEIKEFGLFYFDDEGTLRFDPSEELSTEINFKYAGMEPIELKASRDTSPPPVQEEEEVELDDDPFAGLDDVTSGIKAQQSEELEPMEPDEENPFEKIQERDNDPFSGLLGDASSKMNEEVEIDEEEDEEFIEPIPKKEPQKRVSPKKSGKKKKSSDPITTIIIVILVFVFIAGGYFIYNEFFQNPEPPEPESTVTQSNTPAPVEEEPPTVLETLEPEAENEVTEPEPEPESVNENESLYGLMGSVSDAANDGFSIVVHSFGREEQARNAAANLSSEGYRVLVSSRTIQGNQTWRVSLGQFPTIADAQENASELPSPYNTENFIQRIQTN